MNREECIDLDIAYVNAGEVVFSEKPVILKTILGSCIAVCFYHKGLSFGGMIHGMYAGYGDSNSYIGNAIDVMLREFQKRGVLISQLELTIIGGATLFGIKSLNAEQKSVGQLNADSVIEIVDKLNLNVREKDLGCACSRNVSFNLQDGHIFIEKLKSEKTCSSPFCKNRFNCLAHVDYVER